MKKDTFWLCLTGLIIAFCFVWMELFVIHDCFMSSTTMFVPLILLVYIVVLSVKYLKGK